MKDHKDSRFPRPKKKAVAFLTPDGAKVTRRNFLSKTGWAVLAASSVSLAAGSVGASLGRNKKRSTRPGRTSSAWSRKILRPSSRHLRS